MLEVFQMSAALVPLVLVGGIVYLFVLVVRCLHKYLRK